MDAFRPLFAIAALAFATGCAATDILIRPRAAAKPEHWASLQRDLEVPLERQSMLGSTGVRLWKTDKPREAIDRALKTYGGQFAAEIVEGDPRDIVWPVDEARLPPAVAANLRKVKDRKYGPVRVVRMRHADLAGILLQRGLPAGEDFAIGSSLRWRLGKELTFTTSRVAWRAHDRSGEYFAWAGDLDVPRDRSRWSRYENGFGAATYSHGHVYARFERKGRIHQVIPLGAGYHAVVDVDPKSIPEDQPDSPRQDPGPGEQPDEFLPNDCAAGQPDGPRQDAGPGEQPDAPRQDAGPGEQPDTPKQDAGPGEQPDGIGFCVGSCAMPFSLRAQGCYEGPRTCAIVRVAVGFTREAVDALPTIVAPDTKRYGFEVPRDARHYAQYLIDLTQTSWARSGISARVRLADWSTFDRLEPARADIQQLLKDLRTPPAGSVMQGVAGWRNTASADLVVMLTMSDRMPNATGGMTQIAGLSPGFGEVLRPKHGYSVVVLPYADANLSFLHELGHHFGARHEPSVKDPQDTWYGRGYREACTWRTVMAYDLACPRGVPRYAIWSSCNLWQGTVPAGGPLQNNVRVINEQAARVGSFRP
jgi:hypothetical protein